jgi:hypothetical protein
VLAAIESSRRVTRIGESCYGLRSKTEAKRSPVDHHRRHLQAPIVVVVACIEGPLDLAPVVWHIAAVPCRRAKNWLFQFPSAEMVSHMAGC